jgi:hypothetical protein
MAEQVDEATNGASARSGRYPGVSLEDALAGAEKLYKAEKHAVVDNDTAIRKMGYNLSGPGRVLLAALRQYGLISKAAVGRVKLSALAIHALHGSESQKADARRKAALNPPLFLELSRTHLDGSEENIRAYLITEKGFIETGARIAARAFRDTIQFAKVTASGYDAPVDGEHGETNSPITEDCTMEPSKPEATGSVIPPLSWVLSVPRGIRAELRITGKDIRRDDLERLKKQIDFLVDSFDDTDAESK